MRGIFLNLTLYAGSLAFFYLDVCCVDDIEEEDGLRDAFCQWCTGVNEQCSMPASCLTVMSCMTKDLGTPMRLKHSCSQYLMRSTICSGAAQSGPLDIFCPCGSGATLSMASADLACTLLPVKYAWNISCCPLSSAMASVFLWYALRDVLSSDCASAK